MSELPTPETDAAVKDSNGQWSFTLKETCQRLERERDEARNLADKLARQGLDMMDKNRSLTRERDEARDKYDNLATENMLQINKLCNERDEAIVERDIARLAALDSDRAHDRMVGELEKVYKDLDKAREDATNYYARVGELESERDDALSQIVQAECRAERFCQERDEVMEKLTKITVAAQAVVNRWEQPAWKDMEPTAAVIYRLRDALGMEAE